MEESIHLKHLTHVDGDEDALEKPFVRPSTEMLYYYLMQE